MSLKQEALRLFFAITSIMLVVALTGTNDLMANKKIQNESVKHQTQPLATVGTVQTPSSAKAEIRAEVKTVDVNRGLSSVKNKARTNSTKLSSPQTLVSTKAKHNQNIVAKYNTDKSKSVQKKSQKAFRGDDVPYVKRSTEVEIARSERHFNKGLSSPAKLNAQERKSIDSDLSKLIRKMDQGLDSKRKSRVSLAPSATRSAGAKASLAQADTMSLRWTERRL